LIHIKKRFYGKEITSNNLYEKLDDIENEDYMIGLIIEHTLITTLQKNTLNKFSNLLHLSITNSGITSLLKHLFDNLPVVEIIRLNNNKI